MMTHFKHNQQCVTSLEISDLVQSRHDDTKRSIVRLAEKGVIACPPVAVVQKEANSRIYDVEVFVFSGEQGKLDSITVVAQLCPEFTAALVKRWYELENAQSKLPQSFSEALQLAADQARQLELQAPKVAFVDKYVAGNGNKTFRQVAKLLQIKENAFRDFLECNKIMYRLNGEWAVYSNHTDAKRFYIKTGVSESGHAFNHALFTPKGVEWIAGELAKSQVRGAA